MDADPLTKAEELNITRVMLLGCVFDYNDFGHPERAASRMYHMCIGHGYTGYGYTQADAAYAWLSVASPSPWSSGNYTKFA